VIDQQQTRISSLTFFDCQKLICAPPRSNALQTIYPPTRSQTIYPPTRVTDFAQVRRLLMQSSAMRDKKTAGPTQYLRIARAAPRACAWHERPDVLMVYLTCTSSNAECAMCLAPRKAQRQVKRNSRRKLVSGMSMSLATQRAKSKHAISY
jgi:hypothetical protein